VAAARTLQLLARTKVPDEEVLNLQDAICSERTRVKSHDREDAKALGAEAT